MGALFEIILEIIPPKLIAFLFAAGFIAAGVYIWTGGNDERALYDRATGAESRSYEAEVRRKIVRAESSSGVNEHDSGTVHVNYLELGFYEDKGHGKYDSVDAQVDRDEYDKVKEGDSLKISFHPENRAYVVTPMKARPGVLRYRLGGGVFIFLGAAFILMILASLAG